MAPGILAESGLTAMSEGKFIGKLPRVLSLPRFRTFAILVLLGALLALFFARTVVPAAGKLSSGFMAYYTGGVVIRDDLPASRLFDDEWFRERVVRESRGGVTDVFLSNTPVLAVAWLPLAHLQVDTARTVWIWINVLMLVLAIAIVMKQLALPPSLPVLVALVALFTLPAPVRAQFHAGQMYGVVLLIHTIGWQAYMNRRDEVLGIALGLAMILKLSGWPIALLLLARRRWLALGWAMSVSVLAILCTLPIVGVASWIGLLFDEIPRVLTWPAASLTAYQTTTSFWHHLLRFDAQVNPAPLADLPWLAVLLTALTTIVACTALLRSRRPQHAVFAAAIALVELLNPIAEQYHYILVLLPLAVLWAEAVRMRSPARIAVACVATFLLGWPLQYNVPAPGLSALLHYPRLFGGWIVFIALLLPAAGTRVLSDEKENTGDFQNAKFQGHPLGDSS